MTPPFVISTIEASCEHLITVSPTYVPSFRKKNRAIVHVPAMYNFARRQRKNLREITIVIKNVRN